MADQASLDEIFNARGVAIVGASSTPGKPGSQIVEFAKAMDYSGSIYPINPNEETIMGLRCYKRVEDVPGVVDLVVIVLPAHIVMDVSVEVARRKEQRGDVKGVVVVSGGFSETATPEGIERERVLVETLRSRGIRLIGPNCQGIIDTRSGVNTTFDVGRYRTGGVSIITQSGAFAVSYLMWAERLGLVGLNKFISAGNMSDVTAAELLGYLGDDPGTRVISLYLEGASDARGLIEAAAEVTPKKPVVVMKMGRTSLGSVAAMSHTGSIAGSDEIYDGAFRQAGVIRAYSVPEFFDTCRALDKMPLPAGKRIAVLSVVGGPGGICVDELASSGVVELAHFTDEAKAELVGMLAPTASVGRPDGFVDMTGSVDERLHGDIFARMLAYDGLDGIVYLSTPPAFLQEDKLAHEMKRGYESQPADVRKPLLVTLLFGTAVSECRRILEDASIPTFEYPDVVAKAMINMVSYRLFRDRRGGLDLRRPPSPVPARVAEIVAGVRGEGRRLLLEPEAYEVCDAFGIPHPTSRLVQELDEARSAATAIGYPVVLKVVSTDVAHKTEVGGVVTGVTDLNLLETAWNRLHENLAERAPGARIAGILVQGAATSGVEVVVGGLRDPQFGPVVMFGSGGTLVEVFRDVAFRLAPIDEAEALRQIEQTKAAVMLRGVRGAEPADVAAVARLINRAGELLRAVPEIAEIDFNPVFASAGGCTAVDARIVLSEKGQAH